MTSVSGRIVLAILLALFGGCDSNQDGPSNSQDAADVVQSDHHELDELDASVPDSSADTTDGDPETMSLSTRLRSAGLPAGTWDVDNAGVPICTGTFDRPGSPPVTESVDLSGFGTFELIIDDDEETVEIRGVFDTLSTRWEEPCLRFEAGLDAIQNHSSCGEDVCTPFHEVRICAVNGTTTFFARVPDCGENTFPITLQELD